MKNQTPRQQTKLQRVSENLYKNPASGTYYVWSFSGGKQIKKSLGTKDRALANAALREFEESIQGKDLQHLSSNILFKDFAEKFLEGFSHLKKSSFTRKKDCVNNLSKVFGDTPLKRITTEQIKFWYTKRIKKRSSSTTNKELDILKAIFERAIESGFILQNPAKTLKKRPLTGKKIIIPTRHQVAEILDALRTFDIRYQEASNLIEFLGTSGMRLSEAVSVKWTDIDQKNNLLRITGGEKGTKNHQIRYIPLFPNLKEFLGRLEKGNPTETIIGIDSAKKALATACKHLQLPHFTHHSLRHYFCSNAIEAGIDFKTISDWLGHRDGGVLVAKTYGHLRQEHSQRMAELMK